LGVPHGCCCRHSWYGDCSLDLPSRGKHGGPFQKTWWINQDNYRKGNGAHCYLFGTSNLESKRSLPDYATEIATQLDKVQEVVRHSLNDVWSAICKWYNRKVKPQSFSKRQTVTVYYPHMYKGHMPKWQQYNSRLTLGTVVCKMNDETYISTQKVGGTPKSCTVISLKMCSSRVDGVSLCQSWTWVTFCDPTRPRACQWICDPTRPSRDRPMKSIVNLFCVQHIM